MPIAKRTKNRQPIDDPALAKATDKAVDQAKQVEDKGNVVVKPADTVDHSYQGHSHPNP